jgi:hypothetical protein
VSHGSRSRVGGGTRDRAMVGATVKSIAHGNPREAGAEGPPLPGHSSARESRSHPAEHSAEFL